MDSIAVYGYDPGMLAASQNMQDTESFQDATQSLQVSPGNGEKFERFLELPSEIRRQIYSYVMPSTSDEPGSGIIWTRATAPIWSTCQLIYDECMSMLYSDCTFVIDVEYKGLSFHHRHTISTATGIRKPKRIYPFPEKIAPRNLEILRKIYVRLQQPDSYTGFIKYDCLNTHALSLRMAAQVENLCIILQALSEIQELRIELNGAVQSPDIVLGSFWELGNVKNMKITSTSCYNHEFMERLQTHPPNGAVKNSRA